LADDFPPLGCSLWSMRLELQFVAQREAAAQFAARDVLAFNIELLPIHSTDHAVGQVQGEFGYRVFGKVIVRLEFVEEFGGCHDVVVRVVGTHDLSLAFQRARNQWLRCAVVLVRDLDF
jgi:hypothetical protein